MRVAILGLGAIGTLIARTLADHATVVGIDRTKAPLAPDVAPVDVVIVAVKAQGDVWAAQTAARIIAPDGIVLTIQNGLGHHERFVAAVGPDRVAVGVIYVGASLEHGMLRSTGPGRVELGRGAHIHELATLLVAGGMTARVVNDPWPAVWRKLVGNAAVNPITAIIGCTNGELLTHPATGIADAAAIETARVATVEGVAISDQEALSLWRAMAELTAANPSSMLQDIRAGRLTEIGPITGEIVRRGGAAGIATPVSTALLRLVQILETKPQQRVVDEPRSPEAGGKQ